MMSTSDTTAAEGGMVSIVIPTVTRAYLDECIASIEEDRESYQNFEIIIVNDGSDEAEFLSFLEQTDYCVVDLGENVGFAAANNAGFRAARGEFIMTLNADTVVHPGWLKQMTATIMSRQDIAAVGPTVLDLSSTRIQSAGSVCSPFSYRMFNRLYAGIDLSRCAAAQTAYPVDALVGVCILFRRTSLFEAGLFDEQFLNGWEDMDLSMKLLVNGYALYHAPAVIEHKESFVRRLNPSLNYAELVHRNRSRFLAKWRSFRVEGHRLVRRSFISRSVHRGVDALYTIRHYLRRAGLSLWYWFRA